jgi:hypothetical protein
MLLFLEGGEFAIVIFWYRFDAKHLRFNGQIARWHV